MPEASPRVVVVTGAFGALGRAVARAFAHEGARLALIDLSPPPEGIVGEFPDARHLLLGGVDLSDEEATRTAMASASARLGGLDVLVNVAGGFRWEKVETGSLDTWDTLYSTNLRSAVVATRCALPALLARGGRIVNVGAGAAAARAGAGMGAYTASKAGVQRFTEALADELKDRNVTVNAVLPGTIDTPRNRLDMPQADFTRWVTPEQLARVIVFLASADAAAITGASIPVLGRA